MLLNEILNTFYLASPYILLGLFFSAIIQSIIPKEQITKRIGAKNFSSVLTAAIAGIPLPLCSCGVIPMAVSLRNNGASRGATTSFLIATPETGLDSIMLSFALLDPLMAIFRPIAAFITALLAGILVNLSDQDKSVVQEQIQESKSCCCSNKPKGPAVPWVKRLKDGFYHSFVTLLVDITPWLILGIVLSGIISYFLPTSIVEKYLGSGLVSMLIMLVVGIPLYICASASTPVAASLILKGLSPGAALVFLLVGPATNATTILTVNKFLGTKAMIIYLASIALCALGLGVFLNFLYGYFGINIQAQLAQASHCVDLKWQILASLVLVVLMGYAYYCHLTRK